MVPLTLSLLGPPHVTLDGRPLTSFRYDKVRALLAYLVVEADRAHRREALAELLWPDQPAAAARHSLSQALNMLRQALGDHTTTPPFLLITREAVQWNRDSAYVLDVAGFTALIESCQRHAHARRETCAHCAGQLERAVALYGGEFMAQFTIGDSAAFEEWALLRREWLQQRMVGASAWLGEYHARRGAYETALQYVQGLLALDPWREEAHRQMMRLLAWSNQRAAALRHYERCRALLADELGLEPDAATTALYEQIRSGALGAVAGEAGDPEREASSLQLRSPAQRHNLPTPTTPFVGREPEIAAIHALLADPDCRLITLVGPGGIGKTRLSQHVALAALGAFAHGVYVVPLAPVPSVAGIVAAIADTLGLQFFGQADPVAQLCAYLAPRQMLLLLDNVEHLLDGAALLAEILQAAPDVKLLATSRERLALRGEWVVEVEGLTVPQQGALDALESYSAVQLWLQSARRVQSNFTLEADERACVAQICRLAGGMPLALELAAAWVTVLPCAEIAREIEKNLDFLAATTRDLPERHRSMRAVFDHSWSLVGARERSVFRRLSVFRGGLPRAGAERVADASLTSLAALVAKSLLRRAPGGRYEAHELLRQYGAARLHENAAEEQQTRARHAAFYSEFLVRCASRLKAHDQPAAIKDIIAELENIRAAWAWAIEQGDLDTLAASFEGLWLFFASHGNVSESGTLLEQAIECLERMRELPARDHLLARLYSGLGSMRYRLGHVERARAHLDRSIAILRRIPAPRDLAFALHHVAATLHLQGAYMDERALLLESIALSEAEDDQWLTGYSRNDLGLCLHLLDDEPAARRFCTESLAIFEALGDRRGMAFALNNLGVIAAAQGAYAEAERLHRESLALRRVIDDRWGIAMSLFQLGSVAYAAAEYGAARTRLLDALRAAHDIWALPLERDVLVVLVRLLTGAGADAESRRLLGVVREHPTAMAELVQSAAAQLPAARPAAVPERFPTAGVDALITALLAPASAAAARA